MKRVRVNIETNWVGASEEVVIELDDDSTEQDIADAAHEEFLNYCGYGYSVIDEDEDEE